MSNLLNVCSPLLQKNLKAAIRAQNTGIDTYQFL